MDILLLIVAVIGAVAIGAAASAFFCVRTRTRVSRKQTTT